MVTLIEEPKLEKLSETIIDSNNQMTIDDYSYLLELNNENARNRIVIHSYSHDERYCSIESSIILYGVDRFGAMMTRKLDRCTNSTQEIELIDFHRVFIQFNRINMNENLIIKAHLRQTDKLPQIEPLIASNEPKKFIINDEYNQQEFEIITMNPNRRLVIVFNQNEDESMMKTKNSYDIQVLQYNENDDSSNEFDLNCNNSVVVNSNKNATQSIRFRNDFKKLCLSPIASTFTFLYSYSTSVNVTINLKDVRPFYITYFTEPVCGNTYLTKQKINYEVQLNDITSRYTPTIGFSSNLQMNSLCYNKIYADKRERIVVYPLLWSKSIRDTNEQCIGKNLIFFNFSTNRNYI
jgi:hypothetical protein